MPKKSIFPIVPLLFYSTLQIIAQEKSKPNIVFILADDLGWNDLGCTGSNYYETPNIDKISNQGIRFTQAYSACSVSSPSRASILTGLYSTHHGITDWIGEESGESWRKMNRYTKLLPADYSPKLSKNIVTLPTLLKNAGYSTFFAGKWHVGGEGSLPEDHGFKINIGGYEAGSPEGGYFTPYKNPRLGDGPAGEELTIRLAIETNKFIVEHQKNNSNKPFFAYLSFYAVHGPIQTSEAKWSYFRSKAEKAGFSPKGFRIDRTLPVRQVQDNPIYAGLVQQMDDAVGLVLDQLKDLGLDKNTIIVFTSDNGGVSSGDSFSTSNLPLRGGKGRQWEGGIRVPLLICYPPIIKPQTTTDSQVIGIDFLPTLLSLSNLNLSTKTDGIDFSPVFQGKSLPERSIFWHYPHYGNQGGEPSSVIRKGDWKLIYYHEDNRNELYNLKIDVSESQPLNAQFPQKVTELRKELDQWLKDTHARLPIPDPTYIPQKEAKYLYKQETETLRKLEEQRLEMLKPTFTPNANWWGSKITKD